jgi:rhodanese-related sulfurtransferase
MYKRAASLVAEQGYTNVMTFKGGIPAWVKAGFPLDKTSALPKERVPTIKPEQLHQRLGSVQVVDIRTQKLLKMGWLKDSLKISMGKLSADYAQIPKDKPIVVVDHAGKQVLTACRFLKSKGFGDVSRLQGGLMAWNQKGYTLEH